MHKKAHHLWTLFLFLSNKPRAIQFRVHLVFHNSILKYHHCLLYLVSCAEVQYTINFKLNNFYCSNSDWEVYGADQKYSIVSAVILQVAQMC